MERGVPEHVFSGSGCSPEVLNSLKLQLRSIWLPDEGQPEEFYFEASSLTGCLHNHHRHPHHLWEMRRVHHLRSRSSSPSAPSLISISLGGGLLGEVVGVADDAGLAVGDLSPSAIAGLGVCNVADRSCWTVVVRDIMRSP